MAIRVQDTEDQAREGALLETLTRVEPSAAPDRDVLDALRDLAALYVRRGRLIAAEMTLRSLVRARERALGEADYPTLEALAEVCAARGQPVAAEAAYRAALRAVGRLERE